MTYDDFKEEFFGVVKEELVRVIKEEYSKKRSATAQETLIQEPFCINEWIDMAWLALGRINVKNESLRKVEINQKKCSFF